MIRLFFIFSLFLKISSASVLEFDYTGTISNISENTYFSDETISLGKIVSGKIQYELTEADSVGPYGATYWYNAPDKMRLTLDVGDYIFDTSVNQNTSSIYIDDYLPGLNTDSVSLRTGMNRVASNEYLTTTTLVFRDLTGTALGNSDIPTDYDLLDWSEVILYITGGHHLASYRFQVELTSISKVLNPSPIPSPVEPVPEPSVYLMLILGLSGVLVRYRKKY